MRQKDKRQFLRTPDLENTTANNANFDEPEILLKTRTLI
jgi:hypothetical protein